MRSSNPRLRDWVGKRVWLVGASSGIGAALAQALARRGARLALSARNAPALDALVATSPTGSLALPLDIGDSGALDAAASRLRAEWGGIDLIVWLAGTYLPMRAQDYALDDARRIVETNLIGVLNGLSATLPMLLAQRSGGIALVASVAGYGGLPRALVYGPTKAALINLAESLYMDLHPQGIGVWLINPGFVATELTARNEFHMPAIITPDEAAEAIVRQFASGRFELHFPKRFSRVLKLLRLLPYRLYFSLVGRVTGTAGS